MIILKGELIRTNRNLIARICDPKSEEVSINVPPDSICMFIEMAELYEYQMTRFNVLYKKKLIELLFANTEIDECITKI